MNPLTSATNACVLLMSISGGKTADWNGRPGNSDDIILGLGTCGTFIKIINFLSLCKPQWKAGS